jgi:hypothetical protein
MKRPPRRGLLLEPIIADFDGIRRKQFRRRPVIRSCPKGCGDLVIARVFGDPRGRFVMRDDGAYSCAEHGPYLHPHHLVRDRLVTTICREILSSYRYANSFRRPMRALWDALAGHRRFSAEEGDLHLTDEVLAQLDERQRA